MKYGISLSFLFTVLGLFTFVIASPGQTAFGIKAGVIASDINGEPQFSTSGYGAKVRFAAHLGIFSEFRLENWLYFQPELLYLEKGFRDEFTDISNIPQKAISRLQSFSLPLLISARLKQWRISAGPELEYLFRATSRIQGEDPINHVVFEDKKWQINANLGIAYQLQRLRFELRGSLGVTPVARFDYVDVNGIPIESAKYFNRALEASVAYSLISN